MKTAFISLVTFAIIIASSAMMALSAWQEDESPLIGRSAPSFKLNAYTGEQVNTESFKGKVLLVVFIVPGLPESAQAMSLLESLYKTHKRAGLEIIAIDMKGRKKVAEHFQRQQDVSIPMLQGDGRMAMEDWEVRFSPTYYLIDRNGIVRYHYDQEHALNREKLQADISNLLKK